MVPTDVHVELRGIGKRFGAIEALSGIDLTIERGRIHALVGENGAGKSTLGRLIAGVHAPDAGTMTVDGRAVSYRSPGGALADGITIIAQELSLVPQLSVVENVFLGNSIARAGIVDRRAQREKFDALCESAGFSLDPHARAGSLRVAEQQKLEILRALARGANLIVMDEPTAALSTEQADRLLEVVRGLRRNGTTVVFVSHFLDQVLSIADTVTVLRDGRLVRTSPAQEETVPSLVTSMLDRTLDDVFPERLTVDEAAPPVLSVRGLSRGDAVRDVSLEVRAGEIVGVAGLVGSGRTELLRTIFGAEPADSGIIEVAGKEVRVARPGDAMRAGIAMLPESRKDDGLLVGASIRRNIVLPNLSFLSRAGWMTARGESRASRGAASRVDIRGASLDQPVSALSGGNQQKTMFAKWLVRRPAVLMVDEPTRGVDVGAKRTIYELIRSLAAEGMGVLMVSSEIEEIQGLSNRVYVMRSGRIAGEFAADAMDESVLLHTAFGAEGVAA